MCVRMSQVPPLRATALTDVPEVQQFAHQGAAHQRPLLALATRSMPLARSPRPCKTELCQLKSSNKPSLHGDEDTSAFLGSDNCEI